MSSTINRVNENSSSVNKAGHYVPLRTRLLAGRLKDPALTKNYTSTSSSQRFLHETHTVDNSSEGHNNRVKVTRDWVQRAERRQMKDDINHESTKDSLIKSLVTDPALRLR